MSNYEKCLLSLEESLVYYNDLLVMAKIFKDKERFCAVEKQISETRKKIQFIKFLRVLENA